jgi:hypothetical protein
MRRLFVFAVLCTLSFSAEARELFNGKDLTNWYTFLKGRGKNSDPQGVFAVANGVLHVNGLEMGCITTEEEFSDYRLLVEFRWTGGDHFCGKEKMAPDSGILFHSTGPDGKFHGLWMLSHEYNLILGGSGDLWTVGSKEHPEIFVEGEAGEEKLGGRYAIYQPGGKTVHLVGNDRLCRFDIARDWTDTKDVKPAVNENPIGEWNTAEVVCDGDRAEFLFNGKTVNRLTRVSPSRGRIQLQSEGCPVEFRRIAIFPLER